MASVIVSLQLFSSSECNVPMSTPPLWFRDWCSLLRNGLPDILHLSLPTQGLALPKSTLLEEGTQASCFNCPLLELLRRCKWYQTCKKTHTPTNQEATNILVANSFAWYRFPSQHKCRTQQRLATPVVTKKKLPQNRDGIYYDLLICWYRILAPNN